MSKKRRSGNARRRNGEAELPIALRYGKAIADVGWSAIPNLFLDFAPYLQYTTPEGKVLRILDQEAYLLVLLMRHKQDKASPACNLQNVRTQAPYNTRRSWVTKLKRMGLLFTRVVFYPPQGGQPPRPSHTEWDLENLFDNLLAVHAVWQEGEERHQAQGLPGHYELPEDFAWEVRLFPATAQRIVDGYYGDFGDLLEEAETPGGRSSKKLLRVPKIWVEEARRVVEAMAERPNDGPSSFGLPNDGWSSFGASPNDGESSFGLPNDGESSFGRPQMMTSTRIIKESTTCTSITVPHSVPLRAGSARIHAPLLDEIPEDLELEEQAKYVAYWLEKLVSDGNAQAANRVLAKAFGRAIGFQRDDGQLSVEPNERDYSRLGGMAKEFADIGGHLAVWRAARGLFGRELEGDPLVYLNQCLIEKRRSQQEAQRHERKRPQAYRQRDHGYRRRRDDGERDYLASEFVEG